MYRDVRGPDGRLLFRFDPDRDLVEIRDRGQTYVIDLSPLRPQSPPAAAAATEAAPSLDTEQPFAL